MFKYQGQTRVNVLKYKARQFDDLTPEMVQRCRESTKEDPYVFKADHCLCEGYAEGKNIIINQYTQHVKWVCDKPTKIEYKKHYEIKDSFSTGKVKAWKNMNVDSQNIYF